MAHMIEMIDGQASMAWAGDLPWHGLGTKVSNDLTPEQMLKAANLDWKVTPVPAFATIDGKQVDIGRSALVRDRDNSVLDVITNDWVPNQNSDAFEFFNDFIALVKWKCTLPARFATVRLYGLWLRSRIPLNCSRATRLIPICSSRTLISMVRQSMVGSLRSALCATTH